MRAVIQRVTRGAVRVDDEVVGEIGTGAVVLLGVMDGDTADDADRLAGKIARLRIFRGDDKPIDRSLLDIGGEALVVSQFTLCADTRKGNRPSFVLAASPEEGRALYERFCEQLRGHGIRVATGRFGAMMDVEIRNDGPVTIALGW